MTICLMVKQEKKSSFNCPWVAETHNQSIDRFIKKHKVLIKHYIGNKTSNTLTGNNPMSM